MAEARGLPCPYIWEIYLTAHVFDFSILPPISLPLLLLCFNLYFRSRLKAAFLLHFPVTMTTILYLKKKKRKLQRLFRSSSMSLWHCPFWGINRFKMSQAAAQSSPALLSPQPSHMLFGSTVPKTVGVLSKKCAHVVPVWTKRKVRVYQKRRLQITRLNKLSILQITKHFCLLISELSRFWNKQVFLFKVQSFC